MTLLMTCLHLSHYNSAVRVAMTWTSSNSCDTSVISLSVTLVGPLIQRMTHPKKQTHEIHKNIDDINIVEDRRVFYVDNIVVICCRENIPKLQVFKEELMKKFKIA